MTTQAQEPAAQPTDAPPMPPPAQPAPQQPESAQQTQTQTPPPQPAPQPAPPPPASQSFDTANYTCSANTYNCTDFKTQAQAQAVYDKCGGVSNDVHKLDKNKDGHPCDSLP